ncbi:hypothetical protein BC828DRAFT_379397, partial [Blastocladiella britannica]
MSSLSSEHIRDSLRSATNLFRRAQALEKENELEDAFDAYSRFVELALGLAEHPSSSQLAVLLGVVHANTSVAVTRLEVLRPVVARLRKQARQDASAPAEGPGAAAASSAPAATPVAAAAAAPAVPPASSSLDRPAAATPPKPALTPQMIKALTGSSSALAGHPLNAPSPPVLRRARPSLAATRPTGDSAADGHMSPPPTTTRLAPAAPVNATRPAPSSLATTGRSTSAADFGFLPLLPEAPPPFQSSFPAKPRPQQQQLQPQQQQQRQQPQELPPPHHAVSTDRDLLTFGDSDVAMFQAKYPSLDLLGAGPVVDPFATAQQFDAQPPPHMYTPFYPSVLAQTPPPPLAPTYAAPAYAVAPSPATRPVPAVPSPSLRHAALAPSAPPAVRTDPPPTHHNHRRRGRLEGGKPLRTVFVPLALIDKFIGLAAANTDRKVETCGVLAGKLFEGQYYITHLVVPLQESTPDTCTMIREEDVLMYLDKRQLFSIGWIHTHPTQSCFMSSVDLHNHLGYQICLDEAIAVVVSPRHGEIGVYRLSEPPGVQFLKQCPDSGFHPHPSDIQLYVSADTQQNPGVGHAMWVPGAPLHVVDLRTRSA